MIKVPCRFKTRKNKSIIGLCLWGRGGIVLSSVPAEQMGHLAPSTDQLEISSCLGCFFQVNHPSRFHCLTFETTATVKHKHETFLFCFVFFVHGGAVVQHCHLPARRFCVRNPCDLPASVRVLSLGSPASSTVLHVRRIGISKLAQRSGCKCEWFILSM